MRFVTFWRLLFMTFVTLWCLLHYDVCWLWHLSHYDVCHVMTFAALWHFLVMTFLGFDVCHLMMFVALWRLSHYDICQLWCLSSYDVCHLWGLMACPLWRLLQCQNIVSSEIMQKNLQIVNMWFQKKNITSKEDNFQATLFSRGITNVKFNWNIKLSNYWNFYES